jgi:hypothetical protein
VQKGPIALEANGGNWPHCCSKPCFSARFPSERTKREQHRFSCSNLYIGRLGNHRCKVRWKERPEPREKPDKLRSMGKCEKKHATTYTEGRSLLDGRFSRALRRKRCRPNSLTENSSFRYTRISAMRPRRAAERLFESFEEGPLVEKRTKLERLFEHRLSGDNFN